MKPTLVTPRNTARMGLKALVEYTARHSRSVAWLEDWSSMTIVPSLISRSMPREQAYEEWRFWYDHRLFTGYTPVLSATPDEGDEADDREVAAINAELLASLSRRAEARGWAPIEGYAQSVMAWAEQEAARVKELGIAPDDAVPGDVLPYDPIEAGPTPLFCEDPTRARAAVLSPTNADAERALGEERAQRVYEAEVVEYAESVPLPTSPSDEPRDWVLANLATFWGERAEEIVRRDTSSQRLTDLRAALAHHGPIAPRGSGSARLEDALWGEPPARPRLVDPEQIDAQYPHAELILVACPPEHVPLYTCLSPRVTSRGPDATQLAWLLTAWRERFDVEVVFIGLRQLELLVAAEFDDERALLQCAAERAHFCPERAHEIPEGMDAPFWFFSW